MTVTLNLLHVLLAFAAILTATAFTFYWLGRWEEREKNPHPGSIAGRMKRLNEDFGVALREQLALDVSGPTNEQTQRLTDEDMEDLIAFQEAWEKRSSPGGIS